MRPWARRACRVAATLVLVAAWPLAGAMSLRYCDQPTAPAAAQQDRLLRFTAEVRKLLDDSGAGIALISRSGLDLARYGARYSHAGLGLRRGLDTPWGVRQLYYACDEQRPRVFDQGLAGFVLGLSDPDRGHLSVVLLPAGQSPAVERVLLDRRLVLQLLGGQYSANAYAYATRYQNCNQWVAELLAVAWGGLDGPSGAALPGRPQAQQWLRDAGYRPSVVEVVLTPVRWLGALPWLHIDDHPDDLLDRRQLLVSMPAALEAFVRERAPAAQRIEFCHDGGRMVVHRGWQPIAAGCEPGEGDEVVALD